MAQVSEKALRSALARLSEFCQKRGWSIRFFTPDEKAQKSGAWLSAQIRHSYYAPPAIFEISTADGLDGFLRMELYLRKRPGTVSPGPAKKQLSEIEASAEKTGVSIDTRSDMKESVALVLSTKVDVENLSSESVERALENMNNTYQNIVAKLMGIEATGKRKTDQRP